MKKFRKFPSISQLNQVIREIKTRHDYKGKDEQGSPIYKHTEPYPTLLFRGKVKIHGTNGTIAISKPSEEIFYQKRNETMEFCSDNAGMVAHFKKYEDKLKEILSSFDYEDSVYVYGEWCGGNVQKGVGVSELTKRFVIFEVVVDNVIVEYNESFPEIGIYNINDYETHDIEIDLNNPKMVTNIIIDKVNEFEAECPFAKEFGVSGIGEGLVYTCVTHPDLKFKAKGEKHSVTKTKQIVEVDMEVLNSINEYACTENRLKQGLENVELDVKKTGDFISWICRDIIKEESMTLSENNLTWKQVASAVSTKARNFYFNELNDNL